MVEIVNVVSHSHFYIHRLVLFGDIQTAHELLNLDRGFVFDPEHDFVLELPPPVDLPLALQFARSGIFDPGCPFFPQINNETSPDALYRLRSKVHLEVGLHL